jgi:diadenylate cyclase
MQPIAVEFVSGKTGKGSLILMPLPLQEREYPLTAQSLGITLPQSNNLPSTMIQHLEEIWLQVSPDQEPSGNINEEWWEGFLGDETDIQLTTLHSLFDIAVEIAREGREGRKVGTAFIIGDAPTVLAHSCQMIINPFRGYSTEERSLFHSDLKETIKELAQLDGVFVITGDGVIEAAARRITVDTSQVIIPSGFGTRHCSIAAITGISRAIGIVVSQSGGRISVMKEGRISRVIHPR